MPRVPGRVTTVPELPSDTHEAGLHFSATIGMTEEGCGSPPLFPATCPTLWAARGVCTDLSPRGRGCQAPGAVQAGSATCPNSPAASRTALLKASLATPWITPSQFPSAGDPDTAEWGHTRSAPSITSPGAAVCYWKPWTLLVGGREVQPLWTTLPQGALWFCSRKGGRGPRTIQSSQTQTPLSRGPPHRPKAPSRRCKRLQSVDNAAALVNVT